MFDSVLINYCHTTNLFEYWNYLPDTCIIGMISVPFILMISMIVFCGWLADRP